jgi:hypothetical protein
MLRSIGLPELLVIVIVAVVPFWKILPRLGFSKWLSLLMPVPFVNAILLFYVAFSKPRSTLTSATHN